MTRPLHEVNAEIGRIRALPYGAARTQAAEQQVRLVEAEGPDRARAYALLVLVESYVWAGEVRRAYLPFTQAIRWYDEHPEHLDESDVHQLFWSFKWMVGHLSDFPDVPAEQIDATLADMERRYAVAGLGRDAVAFEAFGWARTRGAPDVDELYEEWVRTPRDRYSQCRMCDPGDRASYLAERGDDDQARRLVEEALATGGTCATEPADMLALLALLHLRAGRAPEAVAAHRRAVAALPAARSGSGMSGARGRRFVLLASGGHPVRALRALADDAHLLLQGDTPASRFWFLRDVVHGTAAMLPEHAATPVRLGGVPADDVAALHAWAVAEAEPVARAFDARNGTTRFGDALQRARAARPAGVTLDLDVLPTGTASPVAVQGTDPTSLPGVPEAADRDLAERLTAAGDLVGAARAWLAVAAQEDAAGRTADAGLALAEAARCAQVAGDEDGAAATYPDAVARLRAGGAPVPDVVEVVVVWAPAAVTAGTGRAVLAVVESLLEDLDRTQVASVPGAFAGAGFGVTDLPAVDPVLRVAGADLDERASRATRRARADLLDTGARVLATLGGDHVADAARQATRAAEGYAAVGAVADAAHASWLAGRLHASLCEVDDAVRNLERAVAGFTSVRQREPRGAAVSALVGVLRSAGRDSAADEVLRSLTG